jgi:lipopolysaccharide/colanic/teichoic acid biosynthesis glycosyltransferase
MYHFTKRLLDVTLASATLTALAAPLLGVAAALRLTGEGKVLFRQPRVGYRNEPFDLLKFVTMRTDSEKSGTITVRGDPRILPVGRMLRKTKINELPQLLNVIKGDMSLVGPRPLTDEAFDLYPPEYKDLVYRSKPGLTGIGSVVFRDEEGILAESTKERMQCYVCLRQACIP